MGSCSEIENSWAWISPSGEFHDIDDHGGWAEWHSQYRKAIIEEWAYGDTDEWGGPKDLMSRGGWEHQGGTSGKKIRVTPDYFRLMVDQIAGASTDEQLWAMEAPKDGKAPTIRTTFTIRPKVFLQIETQRRLRHLPNLFFGQWTPDTHLTREENKFIFWAEDTFGKGNWYETHHERVLDSDEQKHAEAWEMMKWHLVHNGRRAGCNHLLRLGWMQATNPFYVRVMKGTHAPWDTFFTKGVECVDKDPMEEDFGVDFWKISESGNYIGDYDKMTFGEALTRFASRRVSDTLFGVVMERFHKSAARVASRYLASSNVYYHVTEQDSVTDILRDGFLPGWGDVGLGVYFYGTLHSAERYAAHGGWDGKLEHPVILEVRDDRIRQILSHELDSSWDVSKYADMFVLDSKDEDEPFVPAHVRVIP